MEKDLTFLGYRSGKDKYENIRSGHIYQYKNLDKIYYKFEVTSFMGFPVYANSEYACFAECERDFNDYFNNL